MMERWKWNKDGGECLRVVLLLYCCSVFVRKQGILSFCSLPRFLPGSIAELRRRRKPNTIRSSKGRLDAILLRNHSTSNSILGRSFEVLAKYSMCYHDKEKKKGTMSLSVQLILTPCLCSAY